MLLPALFPRYSAARLMQPALRAPPLSNPDAVRYP